MGAPFSSEVRARLAGVHKAALIMVILQFIFALVTIGLAASLSGIEKDAQAAIDNDPNNSPQSSVSQEAEHNMFEVIALGRKTAIAYAFPLLLLQIGAILAYGFLKRGAVIAIVVFQSIGIVYGIVMLALPLLEATAFGVICSQTDYNNYTAFGVVVCGPLKHRFYAVTACMAITVVLAFIQSVMGCIGVGKVTDAYKGFDRDRL